MDLGKLSQSPLPFRCQSYEHSPAVGAVDAASQDLELGHPIDQLDCCVMPNEKVLCEVPDGDGPAVGESPDSKQRLMLLGRQAYPVGG